MKITHLNKTFDTVHFDETLTTDQCAQIRHDFVQHKYTKQQVDDELKKLSTGGSSIAKIYDTYFYNLMCDSRIDGMKWSINEFMQCDDLIRFASGKFKNNPDFFKSTTRFNENLRTLFRLSPSGTAGKLSNFPYRACHDIIKKYNVNGRYFDYSCGWGVRMLASMVCRVEYHGTDPNTNLCKKLEQVAEQYAFLNKTGCATVYNQGSETHIPQLDNQIGLAFSSPPYFNLEQYASTGQSTSGRSYEQWLQLYWQPTVENIKKYLVPDGHFILNTKGYKTFDLSRDMNKIITDCGFQSVEEFPLKNINRPVLSNHGRSADEMCTVYKKFK